MVTNTLTVPAVPAGVVQVAEVAEATFKLVQAAPPTVMAVAPVKLVPVIVMAVPPAEVPEVGLTAVTVGGAAGVVQLALVPPLIPEHVQLYWPCNELTEPAVPAVQRLLLGKMDVTVLAAVPQTPLT